MQVDIVNVLEWSNGDNDYNIVMLERPWRSGNVMNCHATAPGSIPGRDGVFTEFHVLCKGQ